MPNLISKTNYVSTGDILWYSKHVWEILVYKSQQDAHVTEFILSDNCSTYFGCYYHASSRTQTTVTTASGNHYTLLLSAAIVEELELIWVCCGWRAPPTTHSNQFQLFHVFIISTASTPILEYIKPPIKGLRLTVFKRGSSNSMWCYCKEILGLRTPEC